MSQLTSDLTERGCRLAFESGRYLVGACGELSMTITDVKTSKGVDYAISTSGINHLGGLWGLRRIPQIRARGCAQPTTQVASIAGAQTHQRLAGPLCTPVDILSPQSRGNANVGSRVTIPNVGAYGLSASLSNFLSHPYPIEVLLDGDQKLSATRRRLVFEEVCV